MERHYVYILQSLTDNSFYVGCTNDLRKRINEHNLGTENFTAKKTNWCLAWYAMFLNKKKAYDFEKYLKSGSGIAFRKKRMLP